MYTRRQMLKTAFAVGAAGSIPSQVAGSSRLPAGDTLIGEFDQGLRSGVVAARKHAFKERRFSGRSVMSRKIPLYARLARWEELDGTVRNYSHQVSPLLCAFGESFQPARRTAHEWTSTQTTPSPCILFHHNVLQIFTEFLPGRYMQEKHEHESGREMLEEVADRTKAWLARLERAVVTGDVWGVIEGSKCGDVPTASARRMTGLRKLVEPFSPDRSADFDSLVNSAVNECFASGATAEGLDLLLVGEDLDPRSNPIRGQVYVEELDLYLAPTLAGWMRMLHIPYMPGGSFMVLDSSRISVPELRGRSWQCMDVCSEGRNEGIMFVGEYTLQVDQPRSMRCYWET